MSERSKSELLGFTTDIVASFVSHNPVPANSLTELIRSVHDTMSELASDKPAAEARPHPAVPIEKSKTNEYLICLEDGKKLKMLKRYLRTRYDLSPEEYRARWGLPSDYPMVAPSYAKQRSAFAKEIGLGRKRG